MPPHAVMREHRVTAEVFLEFLGDARGESKIYASIAKAVAAFSEENWLFGDPPPTVPYDRSTTTPGSRVNRHAKCKVVDDCPTLVTSTDFTDRGQTRNLEFGALMEGPDFASRPACQWRSLADGGLLTRRGGLSQ